MNLINQIYALRRNFIIIALTGRTGSGCSTVANMLTTPDFSTLKSNHREKGFQKITNDSRKHEIVYNFLTKGDNWIPFLKITASDVIFLYALQLDFEAFKKSISESSNEARKEQVKEAVERLKDLYEEIRKDAQDAFRYIEKAPYRRDDKIEVKLSEIEKAKKLLFTDIPSFRAKLKEELGKIDKTVLTAEFQRWGNNIRKYDSVEQKDISERAPACLAHMINKIIKMIKWANKNGPKKHPTRIVIDALRNPFEILYFRERYSAFYTMSVNTDKEIRYKKLSLIGIDNIEAEKIDRSEDVKGSLNDTYQSIDVNRCIELSDIFITHDGTPADRNRELVSQLAHYIALILHPGLVPPSSLERVMQVAYAAKLNSGCLSRQVGAAVTNEEYSVQAIGWNTAASGQTPCNLRNINDLVEIEDEEAYSAFEKDSNSPVFKYAKELAKAYADKTESLRKKGDKVSLNYLESVGLPYCFKDLYTTIIPKQKGNQVHTRSLHAEENAFLQLAKYGTTGIKNGKLFTTASCCELCGKKAYQLGITEIYYIDSYPGITKDHILNCGTNSPKMILFHGAIGSAYNRLYEPFIPLKDEIAELSGINPKKPSDFLRNSTQKGASKTVFCIETDDSAALKKQLIELLNNDKLNQWKIDENDDLTLADDNMKMRAWFRLNTDEQEELRFDLIYNDTVANNNEEVLSEFQGKMISTIVRINSTSDIVLKSIVFK